MGKELADLQVVVVGIAAAGVVISNGARSTPPTPGTYGADWSRPSPGIGGRRSSERGGVRLGSGPARGGALNAMRRQTGFWLRRWIAALLGALLLFSGTVGTALDALEAGPRGTIGFSRPPIEQVIRLGPGDTVGKVEMWLDGKPVAAVWDEAAGRVRYVPPVPLAAGTHTVRLRVVVLPPNPDRYEYQPVESQFSFAVDGQAVAELPGPDTEALRALLRINQHRQEAGVSPLSYNAALGVSANRHARYLTVNPADRLVNPHRESATNPLFFGIDAMERAGYYAYAHGVAEVISFTRRAEDAVDGWLATLYHRLPLLKRDADEMGYGLGGTTDNPVNVLVTGPGGGVPGVVLWPADRQTGVPTGWDGAEEPNPLRLYPGASGPLGYTVSMTVPVAVSLTLAEATLTGPDGAVPFYLFHPAIDDRLKDTVALIPRAPLSAATTYEASFRGQVDLGTGLQPFRRTWSFTTAPAAIPLLDAATPYLRSDGVVRSVKVAGSGFGPGLRVFLGGLPVEDLWVASPAEFWFSPPPGARGDLIVVVPEGGEAVWPSFQPGPLPAGEPAFERVPVSVHGEPYAVDGLRTPGGEVLLPSGALAELGAGPQWINGIDRMYATWGGRTADFTSGRTSAGLIGGIGGALQLFTLNVPIQSRFGHVYAGSDFFSRLLNEPVQVSDGRVSLGLADIGNHWARAHIVRLLREGIARGVGAGLFQPDQPLSRAAFVKMLAGARGLSPRPGQDGGFSDTRDHWLADQGYIGPAVTAGILLPGEYPDGRLEPDRPISREEMAVMVVRALGLEPSRWSIPQGEAVIAGRRFTDAGAWSRSGYIAAAVERGILTGYDEGDGRFTYRPAQNATRAEACVILGRILP